MSSTHVGISETGRRAGETHPCSTISDALVEQIRDMYEYEGLSYRVISAKTKIPYCTIAKICRYERRATRVVKWTRKI